MKALTEKSRDQILKESRLLYRKLKRQIDAIDKSKSPLLRDASNRFKEFKKDFKYNDLSKYSDNLLKDAYRDLKYIDSLKSSTLEGAEESLRLYGHTKETLEQLSPQKKQEFWDLYEKAYKNLMPSLVDKYKYEMFGVISNEMMLGQNPEDVFEKIKEAFDDAYESGFSEEEKGELFAENLKLLFSDSFDELFDQYL